MQIINEGMIANPVPIQSKNLNVFLMKHNLKLKKESFDANVKEAMRN